MEILILETNEIISDREFRVRHENISFPAVLSKELLEEYGAVVVLAAPQPSTAEFQSAVRDGVTQDALGNYVQAWKVVELPQEQIDARLAEKAEAAREAAKAARAAAVDAITVDVNGKVFDGNEVAQARMTRALKVAEITGMTTATWVLADNTAATVTVAELSQALALSMLRQGELWQLNV